MILKYNFKEHPYKVISQIVMRIVLHASSNYSFRLTWISEILLIKIPNIMKNKLYDNADSFAMSFDEEWKNVDCDDIRLKIDKVFELLSDHPFLISNPENARKMAEFRIFSLKKFQ